MAAPVLLARGRDADVFALDDARVLRRYRKGGDVAPEAAVMAHVAAFGFPVPVVHEASGADLVLERLDGPTMLAALLAGDVGVDEAAACLTDLLGRLHALPPRIGAADEVRVLHLDLHPDNVVLTGRGPVVIDWRNSAEGPPELDLAVSALILAQVAVGDAHPWAPQAGALLRAFLDRVDGDVLTALPAAVARRRADPALTAREVRQLDAAAALVHGHARRPSQDVPGVVP